MKWGKAESLGQSQAFMLGGQALHLALSILAVAQILRRVSDDVFASFIFIAAILALAVQVVDAGFSTALNADLSRGQTQSARRILLYRFCLAIGFADLLWLALKFFAKAEGLSHTALLWMPWISLVICLLPLRSYQSHFAAARQNRVGVAISLTAQTTFFITVLWALKRPAGQVQTGLFTAIMLRENIKSVAPIILDRYWRASRNPLQDASDQKPADSLLFLSLATLSSALYFHLDVFMLEAWSKAAAVADYGLAKRMVGPLIMAAGLMAAPLTPFLSQLSSAAKPPRRRFFFKALIFSIGVLSIPCVILLEAQGLLVWFKGSDDPNARDVLALLSLTPLGVCLGATASIALIAANAYKKWFILTLAALTLNILGNAIVIPRYGAAGAAATTLVVESCLGFVAIVLVARILPGPRTPFGIKDILFLIGPAVLTWLAMHFINSVELLPSPFGEAICGIFGLACFLLLPLGRRLRRDLAGLSRAGEAS